MEKHIGPYLFRLVNEITRRNDKVFCEYGINGNQARLLRFIQKNSTKGNVYQQMVEEEWNIRRSSVTSSLGILEEKGFIIRNCDLNDARKKNILLTEKGQELSNKIRKNIDYVESKMKEEITDEEYQFFIALIDRMTKVLIETGGEK